MGEAQIRCNSEDYGKQTVSSWLRLSKKKGIRQAHSCTFWGEAQEGSHYRARVNVRLHCTGYTEEQDALKKLKTEDEASQRVSSSHSH